MEQSSTLRAKLLVLASGLFVFIVFGLLWAFIFGPKNPDGFGWYLFSYAMGLTMIVLPCTLPLAFVIVPLSMGKGAAKGLGIAISFGIGVALTLSLYGVLAAAIGGAFISQTGAHLETVKNWVYFIAGIFAYIFALGEIGLVRFRMPSYTGAAPAFIQKQQDFIKAFLLGLFLGNIGVGCPHPATPLIFTEIASSGNIFYGWSLFLVHAIGRIVPLIFLAVLGILGVNGLSWLVKRKEKLERTTGWAMVFVASFILVLGLFTHDWWVNSGQHTLLEGITGEERFLSIISSRIGAVPPHHHGLAAGTGLFGLPLRLGNWALVLLWVLPLWWFYLKRKREAVAASEDEKKIETRARPLRFWLFISLSFLFAITFIYTLPQRFLHQVTTIPLQNDRHDAMSIMSSQHHVTTLVHEESEVKEGLLVNFKATPVPVSTDSLVRFDFTVNNKSPLGLAPVSLSALQIEHEKLMHVIGVRDDMNEFFHIHPQPTSALGVMTTLYQFSKPGVYKVWSEIKKDGVNHSFGHPSFSVVGKGASSEKEVIFANNVIVGDYQVSLKHDAPIVKGQETQFVFDIHTLTGKEVNVEPYLGASMHLSIIKDGLKEFIHTHPEEAVHSNAIMSLISKVFAHEGDEENNLPSAGVDEVITFRVTFPEAGLYKMFAQFRPKGINLPPDEALTASLWVAVEENAPIISQWWGLLFASLILIVFLSFAVKRFLTIT